MVIIIIILHMRVWIKWDNMQHVVESLPIEVFGKC